LASCKDETDERAKEETESQVLKFRVTCSRAGEKHCFTSNEAARDFGGAVQEYFKWKADMTNFDVEVGTGSDDLRRLSQVRRIFRLTHYRGQLKWGNRPRIARAMKTC
jgi:hypothetical protein